MDMLTIILNNTEDLDAVLETLLKVGVRGATVIDSSGMGRTLCTKVPLFGGIRNLFEDCRPNNVTIFSVIKDPGKLRNAINAVKKTMGDLERPGAGFMFVVPVTEAYGFAPELNGHDE
ncbi:P-II family nitrogen regulator [Dethiobacter alkaliphilus]|uniref:Nitrogen regulatory protein P-II n=1 Tax=Dethiobacter alkaliphilus AHT 1 TaxID=555088 RepID=C0GDL5_DETAL|nr:P-II family nitrogen regulator [Dethiobacter alkaliphilus]EEG78498.1 nitrogen regulatory protein P-II [Dethiobacter alkaliphilus AHT 1]